MAEAVFDEMGAVLTQWTMGAPAAPAASAWQAEIGTEPSEAELRLLALSGQFLSVAVTAEPPTELRALPDIPVLTLPTMPETLRPILRRILAATKESRQRAELMEFLATRGWTVHPADWMPEANDEDTPSVYAPWRDWAEIAASAGATRRQAADKLTAENWEDYWPATRKEALLELRRQDPAAARMMMETKLANETADTRLRLLGLLAAELSDADIPFLESIMAGDRAPKVKALAASLLARLGHGPAVGEDLAELKGFFSVKTKGLLRSSRVIEFENVKTPAQRQRRTDLCERVGIASLADALGLSPEKLIAAWGWNSDPQADQALLTMIARTGTDTLVALAADAISQCSGTGLRGLLTLVPRLAPGHRSQLAAKVLHQGEDGFELARMIAGGMAQLENPLATPAGSALLKSLGRDDAKPSDYLAELMAVGLLASHAGAQQALARVHGVGLLQGDPRLDMLRLNAALDYTGAKQ